MGGSGDGRPISPPLTTVSATACSTSDAGSDADNRFTPPPRPLSPGSTGSRRGRPATDAPGEDRHASLQSSGSGNRIDSGSGGNSIGRLGAEGGSGSAGNGGSSDGGSGGKSGGGGSGGACNGHSNGSGGVGGGGRVQGDMAKRIEDGGSSNSEHAVGGALSSSSSSTAAAAAAAATPAYFTVPSPGRMSFSKPRAGGEHSSADPSSSSSSPLALSASSPIPPQAHALPHAQSQIPQGKSLHGQELQTEAQARMSMGYNSYDDERFFTRLRASLDLAAWEAAKAVEAGVHAAAQAAHAAHVGIQGPLLCHDAQLTSRRGSGVGGVGESGEEAALRLAERVHSMSLKSTEGGGGGGELHPLERKSSE